MSSAVFWDYYTDDRPPHNLIRDWYALQDDSVRAAFDATLALLEAKPDWSEMAIVKKLEREHIGLTELVIDLKKPKRPARHIRPLGIWNSLARIFILLGGCEKSGRLLIPANAFKDALKYKAHFETGRGTISEHL